MISGCLFWELWWILYSGHCVSASLGLGVGRGVLRAGVVGRGERGTLRVGKFGVGGWEGGFFGRGRLGGGLGLVSAREVGDGGRGRGHCVSASLGLAGGRVGVCEGDWRRGARSLHDGKFGGHCVTASLGEGWEKGGVGVCEGRWRRGARAGSLHDGKFGDTACRQVWGWGWGWCLRGALVTGGEVIA